MTNPMNRRAALGSLFAAGALVGAAAPVIAAASLHAKRIITAEQFAAMEFKPWVSAEGDWTPPEPEEWHRAFGETLFYIRVAFNVMHKTKEELEYAVRKLDDDFEPLIDDLISAREFFETHVKF